MSLQSGFFKKAYLEITNVCNASCSFCPKTKRPLKMMTENEFDVITDKLIGRVEYLYLHLMGEPLLHPFVNKFVSEARRKGFKPMITSNGILAAEKGIPLVCEGNVNKISVSLHSYEANSFGKTLDEYLDSCVELSRACAEHGTVCALRLWNKGYKDTLNGEVIKRLKAAYPEPWNEIRSGYKLSEYVFLEYGEHFEWPDGNGNGEKNVTLFCHGLRNQIGILCDGTVVPCCLDSEGSVPLGNLLTDELDAVLTNGRAKAIYDGFSAHTPVEELCRSCGYAKRFL